MWAQVWLEYVFPGAALLVAWHERVRVFNFYHKFLVMKWNVFLRVIIFYILVTWKFHEKLRGKHRTMLACELLQDIFPLSPPSIAVGGGGGGNSGGHIGIKAKGCCHWRAAPRSTMAESSGLYANVPSTKSILPQVGPTTATDRDEGVEPWDKSHNNQVLCICSLLPLHWWIGECWRNLKYMPNIISEMLMFIHSDLFPPDSNLLRLFQGHDRFM